jgi:proteasome lid subunit RPN8/RPN11
MADKVPTDRLVLVPGIAEKIIAHATAGYPEEVCGLIAGKEGVGLAIYPGYNVSTAPRVAFELDVETLAKQLEFEDKGLMLVAIYHSHPAGPSAPSATDLAQAYYPDAVAIICSVADRAHPILRGFRVHGSQVDEVELIPAEPANLPHALDLGENVREQRFDKDGAIG